MVQANQAAARAPEALRFGYGDHLLVWAARRITAGQDEYGAIVREFSQACGADAGEVLATLCTFLAALRGASRRDLQFGDPGSMSLTGDERQLLTLIAAVQAGSAAHFEAHLTWLTNAELREELGIAARALATALKANDLSLSPPESVGPMMCEREEASAVSPKAK